MRLTGNVLVAMATIFYLVLPTFASATCDVAEVVRMVNRGMSAEKIETTCEQITDAYGCDLLSVIRYAKSGKSEKEISFLCKNSGQKAANIAIGKNNTANMGSVKMKTSRIEGKVINKSTVKQSANIAIGSNSKANMGSINLKNSKLNGKLIKQSSVKSAANIAIGGKGSAGNGKYSIVRTFFATDRNDTNEDLPEDRFGSARGKLTYGECYVSVPRSHRIGMVETPGLFQKASRNKHIMLQDIKVSTLDEFYRGLELFWVNAESSAFIFVHGYNVTFENAARRTAQIAYDLQFQGAPVFYSWPSEGKVNSYFIDETNIKWTQSHLEQFLTDFFVKSTAQRVYLVAHSMGNRALTRALINVSDKVPSVKSRLKEVILAAPDIDADIFQNVIAPALTANGTPVTLYASSEDKALAASKKVHRYTRAGDTSDGVFVMAGVETIDATGVDTSLLGHSYVTGTKSILYDMYYLIKYNIRASQRVGLRPICCDKGEYWVFAQ